jgi:hypothetical protein
MTLLREVGTAAETFAAFLALLVGEVTRFIWIELVGDRLNVMLRDVGRTLRSEYDGAGPEQLLKLFLRQWWPYWRHAHSLRFVDDVLTGFSALVAGVGFFFVGSLPLNPMYNFENG